MSAWFLDSELSTCYNYEGVDGCSGQYKHPFTDDDFQHWKLEPVYCMYHISGKYDELATINIRIPNKQIQVPLYTYILLSK